MTDSFSHLDSLDHSTYCNFCPGYCCYRLPGSTLLINAEDINRIARHFNMRDGEVRKSLFNVDTTWHDELEKIADGLRSEEPATAKDSHPPGFAYASACGSAEHGRLGSKWEMMPISTAFPA